MLVFAHHYNPLCAHLFPGLVWCKSLLSCVDFLVVTSQGPFVRVNGAGSSPLFLLPSLLFLWLFLLAVWRGWHFLCHGISMTKISLSEFGYSKWAEMSGKKLHWVLPPSPSLDDISIAQLRVSVTWEPISGNLDWRKGGFAHHSRGDSSWGQWNPNNNLLGVLSWDSVFWDEGNPHGWEYWRSDVEEEMKDTAVLAPTCHKFSSLAIDPSSSKNTVSCLFTVVTSCLPELCQSCSMAWSPG